MQNKLVNIVTAADFHFSDNPPASRLDDYAEALFKKLDQIYAVCQKTQARFLLIPGDLFHVKTASKTSHRLVQRLIRKFGEFLQHNCRVVLIAGNHDLSFSNLDSLEKQPLGVLISSGVVELLSQNNLWGKHEITYSEGDLKVRIVGVSLGDAGADTLQGLCFTKKDEDYLICMAHVFASPLRTNFFGIMTLSYQEMLNLGPDIFVFGHLHKDQGIQVINGKYFVNVGAISRASISEDDIQRKPKISFLSLSKTEIKTSVISLKVQASDLVFDLKSKEQIDARTKKISDFIEAISKESLEETTDLNQRILKMSFASEVKKRALSYLEKSGE